MLQSEFVVKASRMFEAGFNAVRGADRAPYDEAAKRLAPAVQHLESIMTEHGEDVADGTIARLYGDVARIHGRIQHYDPDEVLAWLRRMGHDLESYTKQMASLCEASIDQESFDRLCEDLVGQGFSVESRAPLLPVQGETPLAWTVIAKR